MPSLRVPSVSESLDPDLEIRPVYIEEWVENLPYADIAVLTERLRSYLANLNRNPLKAGLRWQLLEHCLPPVGQVLTRHLSGNRGRRTDSTSQRVAHLDHLAVEFGNGYKRVLIDAARTKTWLGRNKVIPMALLRAGFFNSLRFLLAAEVYAVNPAGIWREAFTLYVHAERKRLTEHVCEVPNLGMDSPSTLETQTATLILTSRLDPHGLPAGDIWEAYQLMCEFAPLATITVDADMAKLAGQFVFDLGSDRAPVPLTRSAPIGASDEPRVLSSKRLVAEIKSRLSFIETGAGAVASPAGRSRAPELMRHAVRCLGLPRKRLMPRRSETGEIRLVMGMKSLHHLLSGCPQSSETNTTTDTNEIEINLDSYLPAGIAAVSAQTFELQTWALENECSGGLGLMTRVPPAPNARVGEIIGMQLEQGSGGAWAIGVVRWITITTKQDSHIGIQLISTRAESGSLTGVQASHDVMCVVTPTCSDQALPTVILPTGACGGGETIEIRVDGECRSVTLGSLVESTPAFERYRVQAPTVQKKEGLPPSIF